MSGTSLAATLSDTVRRIPHERLDAWCRLLEAAPGPSTSIEVELTMAHPSYGDGGVARDLVTAWRQQPQLTGAAISVALRSTSIAWRHHTAARPQVAISGPSSDAVATRLTPTVILSLIRSAQHRLLIVSFAAYGMTDTVTEITAAADRGVDVDLVLETSATEGGTLTAAPRLDLPTHDRIRRWHWPAAHRTVGHSRAALHAKILAADTAAAFVTSANLTDRAMTHNVEVGVLLHDPESVTSIVEHFRHLMRPEANCLEPHSLL